MMILTSELNVILKRMWEINKKLQVHGKHSLTKDETSYYNNNLCFIQQYYTDNAAYWENQSEIK